MRRTVFVAPVLTIALVVLWWARYRPRHVRV
jgi:hypothetical protein